MKKSEGDAPRAGVGGAHAESEPGRASSLQRAFSLPVPAVRFEGVVVLPLSKLLRLLLPPLLISSLPRRAIGFSFSSGKEGGLLGASLMGVTVLVGFLLSTAIGAFGYLLMAWLTGGTAVVMLYNSSRGRVAFIKSYCSVCRLRPIIEEHETMHLDGEHSEEVVWAEARKKYSYEGLSLAGDPKICGFCPIAKRLRTYH